MGKVIAITNNKGGCGKTTTAVSLGAALWKSGKKVLLLDLDGQANLTASLRVKPTKGSTTFDIMYGEAVADLKPVRVHFEGWGVLDVVPAMHNLSEYTTENGQEEDRLERLRAYLDTVAWRSMYDYIIIDTPPALDSLAISAVVAADACIITVQPEYLGLYGLTAVSRTLDELKKNYRVLFTQYDSRKSLHKYCVEQVEQAGLDTFGVKIRNNVALGEAPVAGQDVFTYAPRCNGAQDYKALAVEVEQWMQKKRK